MGETQYLYSELSERVIGAAIQVHRVLGPGLLEKAYRTCLCVELRYLGIPFECEVPVPIVYRGVEVPFCYRIDLVIDQTLLVELKAVDCLAPTTIPQVLTYLKLSKLPVGLLFNFNAVPLKRGIRRFSARRNESSPVSAVSLAEQL